MPYLGGLDNLYWTLEEFYIFDYVLPFLLIFAVIFAILDKSEVLGKERGINAIIALVIGLLALRFEFVSGFFSVIFPRLGVGLAILLSALILLGLFVDWTSQKGKGFFYVLALVIAAFVFLTSISSQDWLYSSFWQDYMGLIVIAIIVISIVGIALSTGKKPHKGFKITEDNE